MSKPVGSLFHLVDRLGRPRTAWILAALEVAGLGVVNRLDFPLSVPYVRRLTGHVYLDMCAFCSSGVVENELRALGDRGRLLQALLLCTIDLLIPILSCALGVSALTALTRNGRGSGWTRWLLALPLAAMTLDFAENGAIAALLLRYPEPAPLLAAFEGIFSGLKFAAYGATVIAILGLLTMKTARRLTMHSGVLSR